MTPPFVTNENISWALTWTSLENLKNPDFSSPLSSQTPSFKNRFLGQNAFSSTIPPEVGNLTALIALCDLLKNPSRWRQRDDLTAYCRDISYNQLTGSIPSELWQLPVMEYMSATAYPCLNLLYIYIYIYIYIDIDIYLRLLSFLPWIVVTWGRTSSAERFPKLEKLFRHLRL